MTEAHHTIQPPLRKAVQKYPSQGICYPEGAEVTYRRYTFREAEVLVDDKVDLKRKIEVILTGIECKGFDAQELTSADFLYISLLRKIETVGTEQFEIGWRCKHCGVVDKILMKTPNIDFDTMASKGPAIKFDTLGPLTNVEFEPFKVKNLLAMFSWKPEQKTAARMLGLQCTSHDLRIVEPIINEAIDSDYEKLKFLDQQFYHQIKPISVLCKKCQAANTVSINDVEVVILPFRESESSLPDGVSFKQRGSGGSEGNSGT